MYAIGVDIGGTKIAAGVVDDDGRIVAQTRRTSAGLDVDALDTAIAAACAELAAAYPVGAIGLAAPGFIAPTRPPSASPPTCPGATTP